MDSPARNGETETSALGCCFRLCAWVKSLRRSAHPCGFSSCSELCVLSYALQKWLFADRLCVPHDGRQSWKGSLARISKPIVHVLALPPLQCLPNMSAHHHLYLDHFRSLTPPSLGLSSARRSTCSQGKEPSTRIRLCILHPCLSLLPLQPHASPHPPPHPPHADFLLPLQTSPAI